MISYRISKVRLEEMIEDRKAGWLQRAAERTQTFKTQGEYREDSSIWSEIKPVFMELQYDKCAYCERQLESEEYGRIEHDLEHFRPKKKAKPWKTSAKLRQAGVNLTPPLQGSADPGYHLLAYNPLNYCTSCKPCNSRLKSDNFPIEGVRDPAGDDPVTLANEQPLLLNPVGDFDDDAEVLINFIGVSPMAAAPDGYARRRGLVSIAFYRLDDLRRKSLFRERARVIISLFSFLELTQSAAPQTVRDIYERLVETTTHASAPHANCARSFVKLYQQDRDEAEEVFTLCADYLQSISG
ncbi:MAG: hypothetical protein AB2692_22770 [Candidatus Thiodiazotropha sp.]